MNEEIRRIVETLFSDWSYPGVSKVYDNVPSKSIAGNFVRLTLLPGDTLQSAMGYTGTQHLRATGLIMLQVFTQENQGTKLAYTLADGLSNYFGFHKNGQFKTRAASTNRIGNQDGYFQINVSIPYIMDHCN